MSAAGSLATGLAVAKLLGLSRSRAVEVAHLAELYGGGGLGGVAAILGGGIEVRTSPGIPPWGTVVHHPSPGSVLVGVAGPPIPSPDILGSPRWLGKITEAARGLDELGSRPGLSDLMETSGQFAAQVGLASAPLRRVLRGLRAQGAQATQAMFGNSFLATFPEGQRRGRVVEWLEARGVAAVELGLDRRGARLVPVRRAAGSPP